MIREKISSGRLISFSISLVLVVIAVLIICNKQFISDYRAVLSYQPSSELTDISSQVSMSDKGRFIFFASRPVLDATSNLHQQCGGVENTVSVLGCYKDRQILIYDIRDDKLAGVREVTAAHEMLHAVYSRLSKREKDYLSQLLLVEYSKLRDQDSFKNRMSAYLDIDSDDLINELHSIIGTEVSEISSDLESHYSQYFVDRQKVVTLNHRYLSVFTDLRDKASQLMAQIDSLANKINKDSIDYNNNVNSLNLDIENFNGQAANGWFTSQSQFQKERYQLTNRINSLGTIRLNINDEVSQYNNLLEQYNSIATESTKLSNILDSSLAPAPSI